MTAQVLRAEGIEVRYAKRVAVRDIEFNVREGEVVSLLGPTGAGKTSLFRALVGEVAPAAGRVLLSGRDITRLAAWERARLGLGYVPQGPSVLPDLTVEQNVETFERVVGGRAQGVRHWMTMAGLGHRSSVRAGNLSGGERRLLEVTRGLIGKPRVMICDEPFAGIDPIGAERVGALLRAEADRGLAVVISDHHATIALRVSDRAVLLLDGRLQVEEPVNDFVRNATVREHYLGWSHAVDSEESCGFRDMTRRCGESEEDREGRLAATR